VPISGKFQQPALLEIPLLRGQKEQQVTPVTIAWIAAGLQLKRLNVQGRSLTDKAFRDICGQPTITELNLSGCEGVTSSGMHLLSGAR
jgi:hypothetical protein